MNIASYAFVAPILPGKLEAWRHLCAETSGPRRREHREARRRMGITRERVWLQRTPQGDMAIVYWEVDDPARALQELGSSDTPYDRWFVQQAKDIHGMDLTQPPPGPPNELAFEIS